MEDCFLMGFLVFLLIQHCKAEGQSTSIQSSTAVTLQDGQASPLEPELTPSEVAPVVAPPSLKEVQQAVQEASEQVEGRGAEEVLKELLERVVEAAMGQVEGAGEGKADEEAVQGTVEEDVLGAEKGESESDTEAEVLEQAVEGEVEVDDMGAKGGDIGAEEEQEVAEVDAIADVAEEEKGAVKGEVETAAGTVEETAAGVETGGGEGAEMEVIDESLDTEVGHEVVEETVADLDETGGDSAAEEDIGEQDELSEEKEAIETETLEAEETPAVVEIVGRQSDQKTVVESDPSLAVADVEQIEDVWRKEEALGEETQVDEIKGEVMPHSNYETVVVEPVEKEEEASIVKDTDGPEIEDEQGHLVVEERVAEEVEAEGTKVGEAEGGGESVIKEESVALGNEGLGHQQARQEDQIALETSHGSEKEDQEPLVISAPEPEAEVDASIEQSPENQTPTTNPSLVWVQAEENTLGEKSNHGNEIITPTDELLLHYPFVAQPTLDNIVKDVSAEPLAEGEEIGEANELVEDIAGTTETSELGLEAWKIGAISASVFLLLETAVIIIYIFKCRNKTSTLQRAYEEGCVEPEAATGSDCNDDTLPGNGDTQQIALDPSDAASTMAQNKEQHEEEHAIAMPDIPPSSTEESANTGPGPDSSQDFRTSIL